MQNTITFIDIYLFYQISKIIKYMSTKKRGRPAKDNGDGAPQKKNKIDHSIN